MALGTAAAGVGEAAAVPMQDEGTAGTGQDAATAGGRHTLQQPWKAMSLASLRSLCAVLVWTILCLVQSVFVLNSERVCREELDFCEEWEGQEGTNSCL